MSTIVAEQNVLLLPFAVRGSAQVPPPVAVTATFTPTPAPTQTPGLEQVLFDPESILDIQIEIDPSDWDLLRVQARTMADLFGDEECLSEPHESPFTYYRADLRVNGELISDVGVRKKGFLGSISSSKPSLKISFDEYVDRPRYGGLNRLTLNNAKQDPALVRQCITYGLFARAGVAAPRCNYARVAVNGQSLGVYVHIESIKKPFLERAFGDDSGNQYEGALSDFSADWSQTFERKTNESSGDRSDLDALVAALEVEDDELLDALEPVLDVDGFFDFWAMEVLAGHWDGYTSNRNNFHLYADPADGRFRFIPWGTDGALMSKLRGAPDGGPPLEAVTVTAHLPRRLFNTAEGQQRYVARIQALLSDVWDEDEIIGDIDRTVSLLEPELEPAQVARFRGSVDSVRLFVRSRRPAIQAELREGYDGRVFPLSGPPCRRAIGRFSGSFAVRWEEQGVISATARVQLGAAELDLVDVGAAAGIAKDDPWPRHASVQLVGVAREDTPPIWRKGDAFVVLLYVDPDQFRDDRVVPIDGRNAFAWALLSKLQDDGTREVAFMGMLWDGELTLDRAGRTWGAPVRGSIEADVVSWGGL